MISLQRKNRYKYDKWLYLGIFAYFTGQVYTFYTISHLYKLSRI